MGQRIYPAQANRRISNGLTRRWVKVDRSDWNAVARRMMLPEVIFRVVSATRPTELRCQSRRIQPLQTVDLRPLDRVKEYFESLRNDGEGLMFDAKWSRRFILVFGRTSSGTSACSPACPGPARPNSP